MKKNLTCPNCGTPIQIDEETYTSLAKQVRDNEFNEELNKREASMKAEKEAEIKLAESNAKLAMKEEIEKKDAEIQRLQNDIEKSIKATANDIFIRESKYNKLVIDTNAKIAELQKVIDTNEAHTNTVVANAVNEAVNREREISKNKDIRIAQLTEENKTKDAEKNAALDKLRSENDKALLSLQNEIANLKSSNVLTEKGLKEKYDAIISAMNEEIEHYKSYKSKLTVKLLGESLEEHCATEYDTIRPLLPNASFGKDNVVSAESGSKGDFIFRETEDNNIEILSIMFEVKNEAENSSHKHKNEDYFKELDKDRREKNCEYAVLVSMLEPDSELYNKGIVDVSYKYEKMYVIRPQFFIPIITLLRGAALNTLHYKKELIQLKNQSIDVTNFENDLEEYKEAIAKCFENASKKKESAVTRIDKAIKLLQDIREDITRYEYHEEQAVKKADKLTIKKLTKKAPAVAKLINSEDEPQDTECIITDESTTEPIVFPEDIQEAIDPADKLKVLVKTSFPWEEE